MRNSVGAWSLLALAYLGSVQACDSSSPCQKSAHAVPNCAKPCIESAAVTDAHCATTDFACQCSSTAVIQNAALNCVISGCGFATGLQVLPSVSSLCACVTASPTTPCTSLPATTTSAPGTTTTSAAVTTTSSPPPVTPTQSTGPITTGPVTTGPAACNPSSPCQKSADAVPKCAESCIFSAAKGVNCATTDFECQCKSASAIQNAAFNCVSSGCGLATGVQVLQSVSALCSCVTASPTTPCSSQATSTSSPGSSSGADTTSSGSQDTTTSKPAITTPTGPITTGPACTPSQPCQKSADAVPKCAESCIFSAASKVGCQTSDFECQCKSASVIQDAAFNCVSSGCGLATGVQVLQSVSALCSCVSASPTTPCSSQATSTGSSAPGTTSKPSGKPTQSGGSGESSTCVPSTKANCGPVATSAVPSCAQKCFSSAAPVVGCAVDDYACQCQDKAQSSLSLILVPCVATACPPDAIPSVIAGASSVCKCANAPAGGSCGGQPTKTGGESPSGSQPTGGNTAPQASCSENPTGGNGNPTGVPQPTGGNSGNPTGVPQPTGGEQPTGGNGSNPTGVPQPSGGEQPTGGNGSNPTGEQPTGGNGSSPTGVPQPTGGEHPTGGEQPPSGNGGNPNPTTQPTRSPVVVSSAGRYDMGLMACVFGAFWAVAVAL